MLRFIFAVLFFYFLFKFFTHARKDFGFKKRKTYKDTPSAQNLIVDEMKKCPACGTFNPLSHALRDGKDFFCNEECKKTK